MIKDKSRKKIALALSGGVDSAVAAFLLIQQGYSVTGVYLELDDAGADRFAADRVCQKLGIPLVILDSRLIFEKKIKQPFFNAYQSGVTPNPCVICNPEVKFEALLKYADDNQIEYVATGHYANVLTQGEGSERKTRLLRAADPKKDQSYFLYRLSQRQLGRTVFPLAGLSKTEVVEIAKNQQLPYFHKESQDICFIPTGLTNRDYLSTRIPGKPGQIVDEKGVILGQHPGTAYFTVGQRYGLNLSGGPYYVVMKDMKKNQLVVTKDKNHPCLLKKQVKIYDLCWVVDCPMSGKEYLVQTRYQAKTIPATVELAADGSWAIVNLQEEQWAVTPGQSLVIYSGEEVVGGGVIGS